MEKRQNGFTAYDYKEVSVETDQASMILDGYENFGWEPDEILQKRSPHHKRTGC